MHGVRSQLATAVAAMGTPAVADPKPVGHDGEMNHIVIRSPEYSDAEAIGTVHYRAWREAYTGMLSEAFWETASAERQIDVWSRMLDRQRTDWRLAVAEIDGQIIGFAMSLEPSTRRHPDHPPTRRREVGMLYVLADHHGSGAGQLLLDAVLDPGEPAEVWVSDPNPRAQAFYRKNGFEPDGARESDDRFGGVCEIRMSR